MELKKASIDVLAGTLGGLSLTFVGHPLDTIKVRLQTQPDKVRVYNGAMDCTIKTYRTEGIRGFYTGMSSPLVGQMAFRAVIFGTLGSTKRWLVRRRKGGILTYYDYVFAGGVCGFVATNVICPMDLLKCQLQVQRLNMDIVPGYKAPYRTLTGCARSVIQQGGMSACFQGWCPTALRETIGCAVFLGSFDIMKCKVAEAQGVAVVDLPFWAICVTSGIGGLLYWTSVYPVDVVKSAIQSDSISLADRKYKNGWDATRKLYAEGGLRRFGKGYLPCIIRAAPANVALLATVDKVTTFARGRNQ